MNLRGVLNAIAALVVFIGLALALPLSLSLSLDDGAARAFVVSMVVSIGAGSVLFLATRGNLELGVRDGFGVVTFGWTAMALAGSVPFVLADVGLGFTDAFFETMSGFTTTGATILTDIESLPLSLLFWRSFIQWLGGMGIIVLSLAILPMLGVGGMQLYRAEAPGPTPDKLTPRIRQTAAYLWGVYVLLSALQVGALKLCGMGWFDAVCHTFTTMATAGFSTKSASIAGFESPLIEWVIIVFMIIAGTNFALHYRARGNLRLYFRDLEWRFFLGVLVFATLCVTAAHWVLEDVPFLHAVRGAAFQTVSIVTTTGFTTEDYEHWHLGVRWLLFLLMFVGGCAGSTTGSMKVMRVLILLKAAVRELATVANPRVVRAIQLGPGRKLDAGIARNVLAFFVLYLIILACGTGTVSAFGVDLETALSATAACLTNVGPGHGGVGPTDGFGWLPSPVKWLLIFLMLVGRLEVYTVLVLFLPQTWKR